MDVLEVENSFIKRKERAKAVPKRGCLFSNDFSRIALERKGKTKK